MSSIQIPGNLVIAFTGIYSSRSEIVEQSPSLMFEWKVTLPNLRSHLNHCWLNVIVFTIDWKGVSFNCNFIEFFFDSWLDCWPLCTLWGALKQWLHFLGCKTDLIFFDTYNTWGWKGCTFTYTITPWRTEKRRHYIISHVR